MITSVDVTFYWRGLLKFHKCMTGCRVWRTCICKASVFSTYFIDKTITTPTVLDYHLGHFCVLKKAGSSICFNQGYVIYILLLVFPLIIWLWLQHSPHDDYSLLWTILLLERSVCQGKSCHRWILLVSSPCLLTTCIASELRHLKCGR